MAADSLLDDELREACLEIGQLRLELLAAGRSLVIERDAMEAARECYAMQTGDWITGNGWQLSETPAGRIAPSPAGTRSDTRAEDSDHGV